MTLLADAGIVDLRSAWLCTLPRAADSAGEGGDSGQGTPPDPPPPADDATEENEPTAEEIKNPRIKELSEEAKSHRLAARAEKERADTAEAKTGELTDALRTARMENAFLRAALGKVDDLDAAWKLADRTGVTITDDGTVTGMDEVVAKLVDRYPYLRPEEDPAPFTPPPTEPSGRPFNGPRRSDEVTNRAVLEKKFPALRHYR